MEEMISEKNDRVVGSSSSSKPIDGHQPHRTQVQAGRTFCVLIAQRGITHINKLDTAL